ncbi:MAG TPA: electron transfer flavoprotein subunit alpha/FixB family protein, partial [Burkholderiales bacterium]|nr:electron transfer flavoprotein subunit alpha/FixB family protein [Burkholderiales bacterium]
MSVLVIAEHDGKALKAVTLHAVSAAQALGKDVALLIAGQDCGAVAEAAARYLGLQKVLVCDAPQYREQLPEALAPWIASLAKHHSHVLLPASSFGKNLAPRIAALLDVAQISDVIAIESADTFKRPIYAGNA